MLPEPTLDVLGWDLASTYRAAQAVGGVMTALVSKAMIGMHIEEDRSDNSLFLTTAGWNHLERQARTGE